MIKIEIRIEGKHYKALSFAESVKLGEILEQNEIDQHKILAYQLSYDFENSNTIIDKDARIDCITYYSNIGYHIYQDTALFILMKAFNKLFSKDDKLMVEHSIGDGVYVEKFGGLRFSNKDALKLKETVNKIIQKGLDIQKCNITADEGRKIFSGLGRNDVVKNLRYKSIDVYKCEEYFDYFLGQLAFNTSVIEKFDLIYHSPGIIFKFPDRKTFEIDNSGNFPKKLFNTHQEHDKWLKILRVHDVSALNKAIKKYKIIDLIQVEEALHENKIVHFANEIVSRKELKIILIAGPSSSGKTTFAKRLSIQLRVNGFLPKIISIDNYFLPRSQTPRNVNGEFDFESLDAIDIDLLNRNLHDLLLGREVEIPKFNFISGQNVRSHRTLKLDENNILLIEGIHGLNDQLTFSVPFNQKLKIYVSALNNLNIDSHNRIATRDSRKIRRIIRDYNYRGYSVEQTLERWDSVREGEDKNIFPFQESADFMFNSILTYELSVLKKYLMPLLEEVGNHHPQYIETKRLINLFDHVYNIQDSYVPSNSILREFIGGSIFKY